VDAAFSTNADPALVELFRAESDTHMPVLNQGLLALERGQADDPLIASMMRSAHSIKGAARIVGIDAAVRVAHILEDCFTAAKTNRSILSGEAVDVLLQGVDGLQRICAMHPDPGLTTAWLESLIGRLTAVKEGRAGVEPAVGPSRGVTGASLAVSAMPDERTLVLPEAFDDSEAEVVRGRLHDALDAGAEKLRLDFRQVRSVTARALALLASLAREAGRRNPSPRLEMEGLSAPLAALLRVTALDRKPTADT
jgi:two-component system sensor histidine kinase and response regulator WspE